jgi:hypothetical protein
VRVQGPVVSGAALAQEGRVLHLSAFSHPGQRESGTKVPFQAFPKDGEDKTCTAESARSAENRS